MTEVFGCGHPKSPENTAILGLARKERCRTCRLTEKRRWRERARERAEANARPRPSFTSIILPPGLRPRPAEEPLTPEAIGSRMLLEAYARYYERHVRRSEAA